MNLLIVDDEPVIRVGLRRLVPWERYGLSLAGEAADGEAALIRLERGIDILLTDIRMPGMDGLELIRRAKAMRDDLGVLVLSCLDDFPYVKEAMKLGAHDYLLKPTMEPEQLVDNLLAVKRQIEARRREKAERERLSLEIASTTPFRIAVRVRQYLETGQADAWLADELFAGGRGVYSILLQWFGPGGTPFGETAFPESLAPVRKEPNAYLLLFAADSGVSRHGQHTESFAQAERLIARLSREHGADRERLVACIGPVVRRLPELAESYRLHERQAAARFYGNGEPIVWGEPSPAVHPAQPAQALPSGAAAKAVGGTSSGADLPYEQRNDWLKAVVHQNAAARLRTDELCRRLAETRPPLSRLCAFVFETLGLAAGYAREQGVAGIDEFEERYVDPERVRGCMNLAELRRFLEEAADALMTGRWQAPEAASRNPFARKAVRFMREHYHRNIGTTDFAEHVRLSRSYLSELYSRETGESLIETLTRIRIEEAKKKLASGEMKVYEVAEAVGFADPKSFAKTFKRLVGCTPKEYEQENK